MALSAADGYLALCPLPSKNEPLLRSIAKRRRRRIIGCDESPPAPPLPLPLPPPSALCRRRTRVSPRRRPFGREKRGPSPPPSSVPPSFSTLVSSFTSMASPPLFPPPFSTQHSVRCFSSPPPFCPPAPPPPLDGRAGSAATAAAAGGGRGGCCGCGHLCTGQTPYGGGKGTPLGRSVQTGDFETGERVPLPFPSSLPPF